ncbi:mobile mystery protein B [Candidatus Tisiphia endosymbiont of Ditula angustiorana]|uniref:Mobile mystery protein B n=1 Tax=Candidatus Tisiphia endosymbiont of Sergentomyia squamirostris TaxID=3113639 RepID=A0AAT9G6Y7_9RICK
MRFIYAEGATPLNQDEINNLLPKHLTTQSELNEWEQYNILKAEEWVLQRKRQDILSISFAQKLHNKMFDNTWSWAGKFRKTQTNIGVNSIYIGQELKLLFDDTIYQLTHKIYPLRETAIRFHHRLVFIHPFPNGNGRFSRLFADLILVSHNEHRFSWGRSNLICDNATRKQYLEALRAADNNDYSKLIIFADS